MPTPECWEELGALCAKVGELQRQTQVYEERIKALEHDRVRLKTIGGVAAFILTGLGVFFAEPIGKFFRSLLFGV